MEEKEQSPANTDNGNKPEAATLIEQADSARKGLEEAIKKREELLKKEEELYARRLLSGRSDAGAAVKQPDKEQELKDKVNKLIEQTGFKAWR